VEPAVVISVTGNPDRQGDNDDVGGESNADDFQCSSGNAPHPECDPGLFVNHNSELRQ